MSSTGIRRRLPAGARTGGSRLLPSPDGRRAALPAAKVPAARSDSPNQLDQVVDRLRLERGQGMYVVGRCRTPRPGAARTRTRWRAVSARRCPASERCPAAPCPDGVRRRHAARHARRRLPRRPPPPGSPASIAGNSRASGPSSAMTTFIACSACSSRCAHRRAGLKRLQTARHPVAQARRISSAHTACCIG